MNIVTRLAAASAAAVLMGGVAHAQSNWDMPTPYADGNFHTKNIAQFASEVGTATNGAIKITVHSAGSLIKHPEIKRAVRQGIAPIGEVLISLHANESPIYGLDSVPFLATGYPAAKKLYDAQKAALEKKLGEEGLVLLYSVPWPPQGIYASKEIKSPADMQGLKFRTYNTATGRIAALSKAVPVQVEAPDIPTAFATGRVESMMTSPSTGVDSKAWDFLKFYYDTQAWLPRNVVIVNKAAWDKLTADQRKAVQTAAAAAETRGWKASEEETASKTKALADNGIKVSPPSPELKAGLEAFGKTMAAEWEKSAGDEGKAILAAFAKGS